MQAMTIAKATAAAVAIMAVNLVISYVAVAIYSYVINPGQETAFYESAAEPIIVWSAILAGLILFFVAGYIAGKKRPRPDAVKFGVMIWASYFLIEIISVAAVGIEPGKMAWMLGILALSLISKLVAIIAGAKLGARP